MSNVQLPQFISPRKMARQGHQLAGFLPVSMMKRMEGLLINNHGEIAVSLELKVDEEGFFIVLGVVKGRVNMRCERCLKATSVALNANVSLACIYNDEQAGALPERYEPLFMPNEQTDLYDLVEEEVLLGLPIVAYHPVHGCELAGPCSFGESKVVGAEINQENLAPQDDVADHNPFAVLAQLKKYT